MTTIGLTAPRILSAEWRKEVTVPSTWWTLSILVLAIAGSGIFTGIGVALGELAATPEDIGALGGALSGISAAEIAVAVFGILAVTGEYASGAIRSSFTAVPARAPVVLAKAGVVGATVLGLSAVLTLGTFIAARALVGSAGFDLSLTAPGVLRSLIGAAFSLAAIAVLGSAVGWLLRSTAGAIGVVFGLLYVLPMIGMILPDAVGSQIMRYLPGNAAAALREPLYAQGMLPAWAAALVLVGWVAVFVAGAALVVRRRDA